MIIGKKILITGGASGIGKLLVESLAQQECHIVIVDRNELALLTLKDELSKSKTCRAAITVKTCDLSIEDSVMTLIKDVKEELQYIDILVNNAGIVSGKNLLDLSNDDIQRTFMVNTVTPFILSREFLKEMIDRDSGHIINLCSASSFVGVPKLSDYAASKAAILSMDESIRLELKKLKSNVKTTAFCPYYINTGMFDGVKTRFSFLLPILKPQDVCRRLIKSIETGEQRVILPWFIYSVFIIKVFPPQVFDWLLTFFGVNSSMDEFKGRN
jgi:all-trans-retinol dehydrogenase (NAD+)